MSKTFNIGSLHRATLSSVVHIDGIGLHSGRSSSVTVSPGHNGIRVADTLGYMPLHTIEVARTPRCTRLQLPSGRLVDMVEHLLAALRIVGLTDVDITFLGDEVPVLDGSSYPWIEAFEQIGMAPLRGSVDRFFVSDKTTFSLGASVFTVSPGPFSLECTIDFPNAHIGTQTISVDEDSLATLSRSRTFVLEHEIAMLRSNNLALGGSLDNAVVVGDAGPLNPEGFRMPDECARHKALDFIGDLMVLGVPVVGRFEINAPGHSANNAFVEHMVSAGVLRKVSVTAGDAISLAA